MVSLNPMMVTANNFEEQAGMISVFSAEEQRSNSKSRNIINRIYRKLMSTETGSSEI
jgi:hypothetical protein